MMMITIIIIVIITEILIRGIGKNNLLPDLKKI